jgi:hypothetical protein
MINQIQFFDAKAGLYSRLALRGIFNVHPTWDDNFLQRIDSLPEGSEKEALFEEAVDNLVKIMHDVENRNCEIFEFDRDLITPIPPEVLSVIREATLNPLATDVSFINKSARIAPSSPLRLVNFDQGNKNEC